MDVYLVDEDQLRAMRVIAEKLMSGSDAERDQGHRLWLLVNQIKDQPKK